jgi:hypothetical protein
MSVIGSVIADGPLQSIAKGDPPHAISRMGKGIGEKEGITMEIRIR